MNQGFIKVYDNVLPIELENKIHQEIFNDGNSIYGRKLPWGYMNNISSYISPKEAPGFAHGFINTGSKYEKFFNQILYNFCFKKRIIIHNILDGRLFMNFPLINMEDFEHRHNDNTTPHWVCLYYVNDVDGDTVFFDKKGEEIKRVSPKKGRIVFFDGSVTHTGKYPTQRTRVIANFNFIGEKFGKKKKN